MPTPRPRLIASLLFVLAITIALSALGHAPLQAGPAPAPAAMPPVGGTLQMDNACYVRLPDLPGGRYGGFGAYNPDTGVLVFAGGAEKLTGEITIAHHDMWALKLDGSMTAWRAINYSPAVGYLRSTKTGCREMASVQIGPASWVSIGGKGGCDGTSAQWGDIKELMVGATADEMGVRWVPGSGVDPNALPLELRDGRFRLVRSFGVWDTQRNRLVFGQGTFNDESEVQTKHEIYQATRLGSIWKVSQLYPGGTFPVRRFGSCAAYVYDKDTGVDGVLVLGGQEGGLSGTVSHKEVWWLNFAATPQGRWTDITSRFANMDDIGYRREGACAYDPETKVFYSYMGRAPSSIPDGASHSAGAWQVNLSQLGDPDASLTWERLAKDKQADVLGRRIIPSVYDARNKRFFVLGGRYNLEEYGDVWAVYPGVTGDACTNLDPYAPFRQPGTPAPTPAPTATLTPLPGEACAFLRGRVPDQVINNAVANPSGLPGYGMLCHPNLPAGPFNGTRDRLSMQNPGREYHPIYNGLIWSCGCP